MLIKFILNGNNVSRDVLENTKASIFLRSILHKRDNNICSSHSCGFCIILIDNKPFYSCLIPAFFLHKRNVLTIEGIKNYPFYQDTFRIIRSLDFNLCESCFESRMLVFYYFLKNKMNLTKRQVMNYHNIFKCNCVDFNTYYNIFLKIEENLNNV